MSLYHVTLSLVPLGGAPPPPSFCLLYFRKAAHIQNLRNLSLLFLGDLIYFAFPFPLENVDLKTILSREPFGRCECLVLFSDDAQKFTALKSLNEEQQALAARKQSILDRLENVREASTTAAAAHKNACKAVEKRQKEVSLC
jgi:hypothetical protein